MTGTGRNRRGGAGPTKEKRGKAVSAPREETSAGGVVVRRTGAETLFLIIRDCYDNWGFPKGHLHNGERPESAALREVSEETGLGAVELRATIDVIDWHFRFRGRPIHKICHFFLMETTDARTRPQRAEGITDCRWVEYDEAMRRIKYDNARMVLERARELLKVVPREAGATVPGTSGA